MNFQSADQDPQLATLSQTATVTDSAARPLNVTDGTLTYLDLVKNKNEQN